MKRFDFTMLMVFTAIVTNYSFSQKFVRGSIEFGFIKYVPNKESDSADVANLLDELNSDIQRIHFQENMIVHEDQDLFGNENRIIFDFSTMLKYRFHTRKGKTSFTIDTFAHPLTTSKRQGPRRLKLVDQKTTVPQKRFGLLNCIQTKWISPLGDTMSIIITKDIVIPNVISSMHTIAEDYAVVEIDMIDPFHGGTLTLGMKSFRQEIPYESIFSIDTVNPVDLILRAQRIVDKHKQFQEDKKNSHSDLIADIDGNEYRTVHIGNQVWMAENLRTTRYNNGDSIPNITGKSDWSTASSGGYCWYDNIDYYEEVYGKLYNWYAVNDSRGLCPSGWHEPTHSDVKALIDFLGGLDVAGGPMKEIGNIYWKIPNVGATNMSGFSGLPGSSRVSNGVFGRQGIIGNWWCGTESSKTAAWLYRLNSKVGSASQFAFDKRTGMSVRCVSN